METGSKKAIFFFRLMFGLSQPKRQTERQFIHSTLQDWIQIPALCQLCIDYAELPLDQLWVFTLKQLIRFDPKTSQLETYLCDSFIVRQHPTFASLWDQTDDFVFWTKNSLQFGTLLDGKLQITDPDSFEFLDPVQFSFLFQNQFYTIGERSHIWSNPKERKEIATFNCGDEWAAAWIVHDGHLYKFGGRKQGLPEAKSTVLRYSLRSFEQTALPSLTSPRAYSSVTMHSQSNCIFVSGGLSSRKTLNTIEIFDTKSQKFRGTLLLLPKPLWNHYSFCFHNFYFVVGGSSSVPNNLDIWKHALTSEGTFVGDWIRVTSLSCSVRQSECLFG